MAIATERRFHYSITYKARVEHYLNEHYFVVAEPATCIHPGLFAGPDKSITHEWCDHCQTYVPVNDL